MEEKEEDVDSVKWIWRRKRSRLRWRIGEKEEYVGKKRT